MKLDIRTDFTSLPRAETMVPAAGAGTAPVFDTAALPHDARRLRRKVLALAGGGKVLVDLAEPMTLAVGDRLVLDDGRQVGIVAEAEELFEARARDAAHLAELAWHCGSRHVAVQIEAGRLLLPRAPGVAEVLEKAGATVNEVVEPFEPAHGTDAPHGHHHHGEDGRDAYGRLPGDPHYGHDHA